MTYVVPSQQLPPVHTTTIVTTDDNLDMTGLVYTQFSSTAVDPFASHVVDSLPSLEEFTEPVYNQVHQEQIAAGETTEKQEEVIVQEILEVQVLERIQEQTEEPIVHVSAPPTAEVVPIIPGSPLPQTIRHFAASKVALEFCCCHGSDTSHCFQP